MNESSVSMNEASKNDVCRLSRIINRKREGARGGLWQSQQLLLVLYSIIPYHYVPVAAFITLTVSAWEFTYVPRGEQIADSRSFCSSRNNFELQQSQITIELKEYT